MKWSILMLAVFLILGSASIAAAECTWILWKKAVGMIVAGSHTKQINRWDILKAMETQKECNREKEPALQELFDHFESAPTVTHLKKTANNELVVERESSKSSMSVVGYSFICLPDTIDPREKK